MKPGAFCVIADLNGGIGQLAQLLDGLHVGGAHVGGGNDPQNAAVLGKFPQLIHQQAQTAPLDKGHQHVDSVSRNDLLFQLRIHLWLMDGPGKKGALGDGGLRTAHICRRFACRQPGVLLPQKCKQLLRPLINAHGREVGFLCGILNERHNSVGQVDLGRDIPAVVRHIVQPLLHHIRQILRQHLGCLRLVNGRNRLTRFRDLRKLASELIVDNLFVQALMQHRVPSWKSRNIGIL